MAQPSSYATATQIFLADIVRNLYQNNAFLLRSRNWNAFANHGKVNWNQSGAKPGVIINRDSTALSVASRTDILRSYDLDEYQTAPTNIDFTDELVTNYNKRADVIADHSDSTLETLAQRMAYNWAKDGAIVRTSGASRAAKLPSATGNRNAASFADFVKAYETLVGQNVLPDSILVPSLMLADMFNIDEFKSNDYLASRNLPVVTGSIGQIMGCVVYPRATGVVWNNAATPVAQLPKADDTFSARTPAVTDNNSILMWGSQFVTRAISPASNVSIVPAHGGTEFSFTLIAAGAKYRNSAEGIVSIVEAVP